MTKHEKEVAQARLCALENEALRLLALHQAEVARRRRLLQIELTALHEQFQEINAPLFQSIDAYQQLLTEAA